MAVIPTAVIPMTMVTSMVMAGRMTTAITRTVLTIQMTATVLMTVTSMVMAGLMTTVRIRMMVHLLRMTTVPVLCHTSRMALAEGDSLLSVSGLSHFR